MLLGDLFKDEEEAMLLAFKYPQYLLSDNPQYMLSN